MISQTELAERIESYTERIITKNRDNGKEVPPKTCLYCNSLTPFREIIAYHNHCENCWVKLNCRHQSTDNHTSLNITVDGTSRISSPKRKPPSY